MQSVHQGWLTTKSKDFINKICQDASSESCYLIDKHSRRPVPLKKIELKADVVQALASFPRNGVRMLDAREERRFLARQVGPRFRQA